jgi:MFS family permease
MQTPQPTRQAQTVDPNTNEAPPPRGTGRLGALHNPNYRLFWAGSFLSSVGFWIQGIAQSWLVRDLTPSPFLIGFVSFAASFPQLAFSLFSGVFADFFDRRRLLIVTQAAEMVFALLLGALVSFRVITIWHVIIISFLNGVAATLATPTYQALTLDVVGRDDLMSAVALNSTQFNLSRVVGPTAGGLLIGVIGIAGCFYVNGLSFVAVIVALAVMKLPARARRESPRARDVLPQLVEGLRYVRGRPRVRTLLAIASLVSVCGFPYLTFMAVVARDVLATDARGLAQLMAATGAGAVVSALAVAFVGVRRNRGKFLLGATAAFGAMVIVFALSNSLLLSLACLSLVGGLMVAITTTVNTLLQTLVRDEMRGRVMSMYALAFIGLPPVGSLLVGALADVVGARRGHHGMQLALAAGGAVIVLFVAGLFVTGARLKELD